MKYVLSAGLCVIIAGVILAGCGGNIPTQSEVENEASEVVETSADIETLVITVALVNVENEEDSDNIQSEGLIVNNVEEPNEVDETPENINNIEWREGFYKYKGITFPGQYYSGNKRDYETFFIDNNFLYSDEVHNLVSTTLNAALAFMDRDIEKLTEFMAEDGDWLLSNRAFSFDYLCLGNVYTEKNSDIITVLYLVMFNEGDDSVDVGMDMFLNDEGEWKVKSISFSK